MHLPFSYTIHVTVLNLIIQLRKSLSWSKKDVPSWKNKRKLMREKTHLNLGSCTQMLHIHFIFECGSKCHSIIEWTQKLPQSLCSGISIFCRWPHTNLWSNKLSIPSIIQHGCCWSSLSFLKNEIKLWKYYMYFFFGRSIYFYITSCQSEDDATSDTAKKYSPFTFDLENKLFLSLSKLSSSSSPSSAQTSS